ncbi:STAS-like domain-containing protein [Clostridium paraputrificum]|uniref:STAS-like domain-containing protein n=1 Tax=Clostridium TaxID=1485 RepID=UPI003D3458D6
MNINVKEYLGEQISAEDAIVLRETIKEYVNEGITLDFAGLGNVPSTFLNCLFGELINESGRDTIFNKVGVKNLTNYNDYSRVVLGTAFAC